VRFKDLADRKKEVYDDDLLALVQVAEDATPDRLDLKSLTVVCGTGGQSADMVMVVDGEEKRAETTGDGPVDACFNAGKEIFPHGAKVELYEVNAVTQGTDAQATVSVRLHEAGRIVTGQSSDTDTVVASVRAYIHALNRLLVRRDKVGQGADPREISYKDVN
jgi:2-isopropylmalate synthase